MAFETAIRRDAAPQGDDLVLLFAGDALVLAAGADALPRRAALAGLVPAETVHVGRHDGHAVETAQIGRDAMLPEGHVSEGLRGLHGRVADGEWAVAGRAFQLAEWDRTHRFCGVCGAPTALRDDERARACTACDFRAYPRHSPAVIVLITRGADEVLLGRSPRFPAGMYSTLAGFVDPGESAEEAVRREIREEAGIEITEPRWFGSQSWAFPHSLMLGFTAEWASGEIEADADELEDLQWFTRDDLPVLPPPASIARRLLDAWL
ncbi:MAG: NAD(+) diphosphatase [Gaiellales bacterium]